MSKRMPKQEPPKPPETDIDIFALLEKVQNLKQPAIDKLLAERAEIDRKLSLLGYNAPVAPKTASRGPGRPKADTKAGPGPSANYDEEKTCSVCGGAKGHDGRAHRSQEPKKKFTDTELADRGLLEPGKAEEIAKAVAAKLGVG